MATKFHDLKEKAYFIGGYLTARKRGLDGKWTDLWKKPVKNIITDAALAQIALLLIDASAVPFTYGAIGSDNTTPVGGDTGCKAQLDCQAATMSRVTTSVANDTIQAVSTHTASGSWSVKEYVLKNASGSGGTALNRIIFTAIPLGTSEVLEFTYKCQMRTS